MPKDEAKEILTIFEVATQNDHTTPLKGLPSQFYVKEIVQYPQATRATLVQVSKNLKNHDFETKNKLRKM